MAFHIATLGAVSAKLQRYADEDGFVPELGDRWQNFPWEREVLAVFGDKKIGEACWQVFVVDAQMQIAKALRELEDLEWSNTKRHPVLSFTR